MNTSSPPPALDAISKVVFYKRDEMTMDLVCCEVEVTIEDGAVTWFYHEQAPGWSDLLEQLEQLPGFKQNWREEVILPPFAENRTVAFERKV